MLADHCVCYIKYIIAVQITLSVVIVIHECCVSDRASVVGSLRT